VKPHRNNRLSFPLASAIAAMLAPQAAHAQQYWNTNGTNAAITAANWGSAAAGPFTNAYVANTNIVFGANSAITGATVSIGNITLPNTGTTVTFTPTGTLSTGGNVRAIDIATGSTLTLSSQAISTVAGTGFIKNGAGTLNSSNGNAYTGGFTINAGTMGVGSVNAMGAGGALTINGGIIRSNNTSARDLSGKFTGGITIGGNFTLGDGTNNGLLTFSNNMALGAASRTITTASNAIFGGIISGDNTVGITKAGAGTLTLSGANTFNGGVSIKNGSLESKTTTTTLGTGTVTMGGTGSTGATYITGQNNSNAFVINAPDSGTVVIGANGAGSGFTMSGGITLNGNLTIQTYNNTINGTTKAQSGFTGGITGTGNVVLNNIGLAANAITMSTGAINHTGSLTLQGSATGDTTISSVIGSNVTGVTQNSATSRLVLSGANTYTGATNVNSGTLAVNGSLANTSTTIGSGGTLQGSGSIGGSVTVQSGGKIAAGNSIESLTTGALSLEAGSTFAYEINNDAAAGVAGDVTAVTGNLTLDLGNATLLTLGELGTGSWSVGEKLTLISYSGAWNGGLFNYGSTLADDSIIDFSGMDWLFNYNDTAAGTNYTGDLTGSSFVTMTAVPEPDAAALVGGLGMLALLRRRRR
jgi:autotransporter-associated beta strand protein